MDAQTRITNLSKMLDGPRDGALLRFGLGNAWLDAGQPAEAVTHFREAVRRDPQYTAAWKLLGKALLASGDADAALGAYRQGLAVAEARGDMQAVREIGVFIRRLEREAG